MKRITALIAAFAILFSAFPVFAAGGYEKKETVRVKLDTTGRTRKITVEDWLKIKQKSGSVRDVSNLKEIINREGDEKFSRSGRSLTWQNRGEDISYSGKGTSKLPVSIRISYYLNGERISAKKLAGKTGNVKIRFDYKNNELRRIDGKDVHVPFLCATGLVLPSNIFSKIRVSNGRIMEDRNQSIVLGIAAPSVKGDLGLDAVSGNDIPLEDFFEVEAYAKHFELDFTATMVSTVGLDEVEDIRDAKSLAQSMSAFTDASSRLLDGTERLNDSMDTMSRYLLNYFSGVRKLDSSIEKFNSSLKTMTVQKKELDLRLKDIDSRLKKYVALIKAGKDSEETREVEELVNSILSDTKNAYEYLEDMKKQLDELNSFIENAKAYSNEIDIYRNNVTDKIKEVDIESIKTSTEELENTINGIESLSPEEKEMLLEKTGEIKNQTEREKADRQSAIDAAGEIPEYDVPEIQTIDTAELEKIISTLKKEQEMLDRYDSYLKKYSSASELFEDIRKSIRQAEKLNKTVEGASAGIDELYKATKMIKKGSSRLADSSLKLEEGLGGINGGMDRLEKGVRMFSKGADKFSKLSGNSLSNTLAGFDRLKKAERTYSNYSGIKSGVKGSVFFIYESDEIKK